MGKTEESKLEQQVDVFMKEKCIWKLSRYQAQSNQNGLPDRLYLYKGLLLGFELKTNTGVPTQLQLNKLKAINENGGIGVIIRSVDDIKTVLETIKKSAPKFNYGWGEYCMNILNKEFNMKYEK